MTTKKQTKPSQAIPIFFVFEQISLNPKRERLGQSSPVESPNPSKPIAVAEGAGEQKQKGGKKRMNDLKNIFSLSIEADRKTPEKEVKEAW